MMFAWVFWNGGAAEGSPEVKYSIRSVLKNYDGQAKILIIGDKPNWYTGPHYRVPRIEQTNLMCFKDSFNKIYKACKFKQVDEEFCWMMDDIYWVKPFGDNEVKKPFHGGYWDWGKIRKGEGRNRWQRIRVNTFKFLAEKGFQTYDFATHAPHYVERANFMKMTTDYPFNSKVFLWENIYGNIYYRFPVSIGGRIYRFLKPRGIDTIIKNRRDSHIWMNNGSGAWNEHLHNYLEDLFPQKTEFEL